MSKQEFLKSFAVSGQALEFIEEVLQPELNKIKDVTKGKYENATNGEIFMGKVIASEMLQELIDEIKHWKTVKEVKKKDKKDNFN